MSGVEFRLCTFVRHGFQAVGLGVGAEPAVVVDVQRAFGHLHRGDGLFLQWPTQLDMLQVLTNWDYFVDRLQVLADKVQAGQLPGVGECDFVHPESA